jgi:hypothetical protein
MALCSTCLSTAGANAISAEGSNSAQDARLEEIAAGTERHPSGGQKLDHHGDEPGVAATGSGDGAQSGAVSEGGNKASPDASGVGLEAKAEPARRAVDTATPAIRATDNAIEEEAIRCSRCPLSARLLDCSWLCPRLLIASPLLDAAFFAIICNVWTTEAMATHDPRFHYCPHVINGKPCQGKANLPVKDPQGRPGYKCTRCSRVTSEEELRRLSRARMPSDDD